MKKRTAFICSVLSLISFGQPLLIKTGVVLSTSGLILSLQKNVKAESGDFYYERGITKAEKKDYKGSIEDFTKAIEINPVDFEAYYLRGLSKNYLKKYKLAIEDFTKAIEIDPNIGQFYFSRGFAKNILNDDSDCSDAKKAISLGYKDPINIKWVRRNCSKIR